jgi:GLPGLI family protein
MTVEGVPPEQASFFKGMETKIFFKGEKSRTETNSAFGSYIVVTDEKQMIMLMDQMGQKQFVKMSKEEMEKENKKRPDPKITYTDEKKTIAGYECKKAVVESKDEKGTDEKTDVWYCEQLPYKHVGRGGDKFKGLKGAALEFDMAQGPMKIKMAATEVSKSPVADSKFVISTDGYTEIKMEDLKKMQKGGGGK